MHIIKKKFIQINKKDKQPKRKEGKRQKPNKTELKPLTNT